MNSRLTNTRLTPFIALGLCISPVLAQPSTGTNSPPPTVVVTPPDNIEKTLRDFVDDANLDRFVGAQDKIYGARHGFFGANEWVRKPRPWNPFDIVIQSVSEPQIKGAEATVTVKYHLESRKNENDEPIATKEERQTGARERSETVSLKMASLPAQPDRKVWQIASPETEPTQEGGNLLSFAIYKMAQKPLLKSDLGVESLERLKSLALAVQMFRQDFDEQFAFAPEYVREALTPYLEDDQSLFVPGTLDTYTFNASLSARYLSSLIGDAPDFEIVDVFPAPPEPYIKKPAKVVMFYEGHDQKPIFRYNGKAAICFADGHTALVTLEEARDLIWNPG